MGVARRTPAVLIVAAAVVGLLGACGDDGDARYAVPADDGLATDMYVAGATVDAGGDVIIMGRSGVNVLPPDGDTTQPLRRFAVPEAAAGDGDESHGLSTDATGRTWALVGPNRLPVRVGDGAVHPEARILPAVRDAGAAIRITTAELPKDG